VLDPEDERFETYLKQFRPVVPDALPVGEVRQSLRPRFGRLALAGGSIAAIVILGAASFYLHNRPLKEEPNHVNMEPPAMPLTVRGANTLLANAPSYKAALNELAFPANSAPVPKEKLSALAVLSKEKTKL
jgi:hypothetical protein